MRPVRHPSLGARLLLGLSILQLPPRSFADRTTSLTLYRTTTSRRFGTNIVSEGIKDCSVECATRIEATDTLGKVQCHWLSYMSKILLSHESPSGYWLTSTVRYIESPFFNFQHTMNDSYTSSLSVAQAQLPSLIWQAGREIESMKLQTGAHIQVPGSRKSANLNAM